LEIPIELCRQLVLGAVHFARELGFDPADDFDGDAAAFLGEWDGPGKIEFGRDGQPFYVNGPYDDPAAVIRTPRAVRGRGELPLLGGYRTDVTGTNQSTWRGNPTRMGHEPSKSSRGYANGKRRHQQDSRGGPAEFEWVPMDGRRMFVVGYTAGGAPFGCFEDELDDDASDGVTADPFG